MSWTASLAPHGKEGFFFALVSLKNLLIEVPSGAFNGWLNAAYNPNCDSCRDAVGHFCDHVVSLSEAACAAANSTGPPCDSSSLSHALATTAGSAAAAAAHNLNNLTMCASSTQSCVGGAFAPLYANASAPVQCPTSCRECPDWTGSAELGRQLWIVVLLTSLSSPLLLYICLPFLRGDECKLGGCTLCEAQEQEAAFVGDAAVRDAAPEAQKPKAPLLI